MNVILGKNVYKSQKYEVTLLVKSNTLLKTLPIAIILLCNNLYFLYEMTVSDYKIALMQFTV